MMRSNSSPPVTLQGAGVGGSVDPGPSVPTHHPAPSRSLPFSQLHGQIQVGRALVDILQSHDVGVADPATARKRPYGCQEPLWASGPRSTSSDLHPLPCHRLPLPNPAKQSTRPGLPGDTEEARQSTAGHCPTGLERWRPGQGQGHTFGALQFHSPPGPPCLEGPSWGCT